METKIRVTDPLCGEFTGHRCIPHTKANDAELWCFLWSTPWLYGWANNREAADLKRHRAHYNVIVMHGSLCQTQRAVLMSLSETPLTASTHRNSHDGNRIGKKITYKIQSGAVKTRSHNSCYHIRYRYDKGRTWIKLWTHKRHPISCPHGRAMGCLL